MRRDMLGVAPEDTLGFAAEQMAERDVGAVVVLDYGRLIGILSERDILRARSPGACTPPRLACASG